MENIWDIFKFMLFVTDEARNGQVSPEEASFALDGGQQSLFAHYYGDGREQTQLVADALLPFSKTANLTSSAAGKITVPVDYGHIRRFIGDGLKYNPALHTEIDYALDSVIYPIADFPRYTTDAAGLQLYPSILTMGVLHYYSVPTTPRIGYTIVGEDPEYDVATSVQLQFSKRYWVEVIHKALPYLGVNLSSPEVAALSNAYESKAVA